MPNSPERKRDTRRKILESARRLFNRKGFAEVSIDEIMANAGLTHGGFYRHFSRKDELYAEAVRQFLQAKQIELPVDKARARKIIDGYLSRDHLDDREACCPLIALPSDVSRSGEAVKVAYQEVVEMLVEIFATNLDARRTRERALALVALCVGSMVLARGVDDPALADDLRRAARKQVLRITGWRGSVPDRLR